MRSAEMIYAHTLYAAGAADYFQILTDTRLLLTAALFVFVMIYFLLLVRREQQIAGDPAAVAETKSPRWIAKRARELEKEGEFKGAGDLLMSLERFEEAAKLYVQGKALGRAAEAYGKMGDKEKAAGSYEKRGMPLKAAELYIQSGKMLDASREYVRAGEAIEAAKALEAARQYSDAADIYKRNGHLRKAGELYYRAGDRLAAAQTLEQFFRYHAERMPQDMNASDSRMLAHVAHLIGTFYEQEGRADEAAAAFENGGHLSEAARLHEQVGRYPLAAQLNLSAGKPFEAAICEERAGRKKDAALIRAEAYKERGKHLEAVGNYEIADRPLEAAEVYRELGDHAKAARMFERAERYEQAAGEYTEANEPDLAAAALEKAGEFYRAAKIYEEVGNPSKQGQMLERAEYYLDAGKAYIEAGSTENAIRTLQQVTESDENFRQAQILLGDIFREKAIYKIAIQYYKRALGEDKPERSNLEPYYHLANCLEAVGSFREALNLYESIVVVDYHFGDAADRIRLLEPQVASTPATPSEPSGPSSPYDVTLSSDAEATQVGHTGAGAPRPRRYEVIDEIGRGGMGIVYKAKDTVLDRVVAYKVLPANLREHPQAVKNFFREAKSAAALNHPNIVIVHDAGEEDGNYYIAMEYLRGRTVKQILSQENRLALKPVVFIVAQILRALSYAHERKIIHRDVKSSNVMWTDDKVIKLMDFGLAKVVEEVKASQTVASGTPYYMSPEQTLGSTIDHRTDLYSLGITVFEMVTGRLPFADGQAAYHHVHTPAPDPGDYVNDIPESLSNLILKLMSKNPDDRCQSAGEVSGELKKIAEEVKGSFERPEG